MKFPTFFISHGAPTLLIDESETYHFLCQLGQSLPRPEAILMISAHWETTKTHAITTHVAPHTIYDFYGFPAPLYEKQYPAPGDPTRAKALAQALTQAGFETIADASRGLDHGVWVPLALMYPKADIPVICLSLRADQDAAWHYALGQALSHILATENILICTSGGLTHNLRALMPDGSPTPNWATAFIEWVEQCLVTREMNALVQYEQNAPYLKENHPYVEHFTPFLVACGIGHQALSIRRIHHAMRFGSLAMSCYQFDTE